MKQTPTSTAARAVGTMIPKDYDGRTIEMHGSRGFGDGDRERIVSFEALGDGEVEGEWIGRGVRQAWPLQVGSVCSRCFPECAR